MLEAVTRSVAARISLLLAAVLLGGCTAVVHAPAAVSEPARVAILDHGRHASLLVEGPQRSMIRYAYGERSWYAERQTGAVEAVPALFWPTPAALGRRQLPGPFSPSAVAREIRVGLESVVYLEVERRRLRELIERLDALFAEPAARPLYNEAYDLYFVPHPEPYSLSHNSNSVTADWLRALGCEVDGGGLFSAWRRGAPDG